MFFKKKTVTNICDANLTPEQRGEAAEKYTSNLLQTIKKDIPNCLICDNIYIKTSKGVAQLDHILFTNKAIYVIEDKCYYGDIIMDHTTQNKRYWKNMYGNEMYNPCIQNEKHVLVLRNRYKNILPDRIPIFSIINLNDDLGINPTGQAYMSRILYYYKVPTCICQTANLLNLIKQIDSMLIGCSIQNYFNHINIYQDCTEEIKAEQLKQANAAIEHEQTEEL